MSNWKNKFGTKSFEEFVRKFFEGHGTGMADLKFFNKKAVYNMGDKTAEIVLSTNGTCRDYEGFRVEIIHKDNGKIAHEWFGFKEYLMDGFVSDRSNAYPILIDHCGMDWYMNGATPKAIKAMVKSMRSYIDLYQTPL